MSAEKFEFSSNQPTIKPEIYEVPKETAPSFPDPDKIEPIDANKINWLQKAEDKLNQAQLIKDEMENIGYHIDTKGALSSADDIYNQKYKLLREQAQIADQISLIKPKEKSKFNKALSDFDEFEEKLSKVNAELISTEQGAIEQITNWKLPEDEQDELPALIKAEKFDQESEKLPDPTSQWDNIALQKWQQIQEGIPTTESEKGALYVRKNEILAKQFNLAKRLDKLLRQEKISELAVQMANALSLRKGFEKGKTDIKNLESELSKAQKAYESNGKKLKAGEKILGQTPKETLEKFYALEQELERIEQQI